MAKNDAAHRMVIASPSSPDAQLATLQFRTLASATNRSLLEIDLGTGRKHQIRVHLSDMGHPITGDERYGSRRNPARRLALHAGYLAFKHPVTGKEVVLHSPLPRSFDLILNKDQL